MRSTASLDTGALLDGSSYTLTVETIDNATNANTNTSAATRSSFVSPTTAPTPTVFFPANAGHHNPPSFPTRRSSDLSDASSSVATVKLSIQKDGGANSCWDGTNAA